MKCVTSKTSQILPLTLFIALGTLIGCSNSNKITSNATDTYSTRDSSNPIASPENPNNEKPKHSGEQPANGQPPSGPIESEEVSIPAQVSGTLLTCYEGNVFETSADILCGIFGEKTKRKIELNTIFSSYSWIFDSTTPLTITTKELPVESNWHVTFSLVAKNRDELVLYMNQVKLGIDAKSLNGNPIVLNTTAVPFPASALKTIRNLQKIPATGEDGCLDFFSALSTVLIFPCNITAAEEWTVTPDSKIAFGGGNCLAFDAAGGGILAPCNSAQALTWTFTGEEIRIKDGLQCLGQGALYSGDDIFSTALLACNANDPTQHWKVDYLAPL